MHHVPPRSAIDLEALWEIPMGLVSFGFSRGLRATLTNLGRYYNPMNRQETPQWQVVSAEFLAKPIKLLWAMSRARWNLHALIAIAGPFTLTQSISLNVATIAQGTPSWTAVFYTLRDYETLASISSLSIAGDREWETVTLPPGRYLVGLRHYRWANPITLPAIRVDGQDTLAAESLASPPDFNRFYRDLLPRQGVIHQALNGYVYPLLRYGKGLPAAFVRRVFLPVPNPETQFHFGALRRGEGVQFTVDSAIAANYELFFSLYNRFCFPLDWYPITTETHETQPCDQKAVFILRIHPKRPGLPQPNPDQVKVEVLTKMQQSAKGKGKDKI
ncbi:MAG: hypothetical protein IGR92_11420 [Leptolyngbyaceae cyanobacterium T60_A2020_046]|nr:hypothetical protein [Leptolyngbyaceae cyanobacterium T60_A2020_046]